MRHWLDIGAWVHPNILALAELFSKYGIAYSIEVTAPRGEEWMSVFVNKGEEVVCNLILGMFIEL